MRGLWRLHWARQWVRCRLDPPALILMYHRVAELPTDPFLLAVTPRRFAEQLEAIRQYGTPMRLAELVGALRQGRVPRRAVVVTFDDGYADNLQEALPLLARYDVPATVFITAGQVGLTREFWWDELDRLILQPGTLPSVLHLEAGGRRFEWTLDGASAHSEEAFWQQRTWHVESPDAPGPRQRLFQALFALFYGAPASVRDALLRGLVDWAGASPEARTTHRTLTWDELVRLAEEDLIEIGAHTVSHPVLAALPRAEQEWEIRESMARLKARLNRPVASFAYPHGSVTPETIAAVAEAGFACACASDMAAVVRKASPLRLPRIGVREWDGDTMARHLRWWLGG